MGFSEIIVIFIYNNDLAFQALYYCIALWSIVTTVTIPQARAPINPHTINAATVLLLVLIQPNSTHYRLYYY